MDYMNGYKYRIYPNKKQRNMINQTLGCCRFVYNHFLFLRSDAWSKEKKSIGYSKTSSMLTDLKKDIDFVWLNSVSKRDLNTPGLNPNTITINPTEPETNQLELELKKIK